MTWSIIWCRGNRSDLHRGKALDWLLASNPARQLAPPYRQQSAGHTMAARYVRYVRLSLKALRNDPRLLFRRPSSPALPARNHLDALVSATFVPGIIPGIKHGSYHRAASRNQQMI